MSTRGSLPQILHTVPASITMVAIENLSPNMDHMIRIVTNTVSGGRSPPHLVHIVAQQPAGQQGVSGILKPMLLGSFMNGNYNLVLCIRKLSFVPVCTSLKKVNTSLCPK